MPAPGPDLSLVMSFAYGPEAKFWGVLINPDKSASPLLEHLCLGIAQIIATFDNYATTDLTPERLATFYRKVGGNYDILFLDTKPAALSFIYQRLGCFHSIQPSLDPYKPPSVPALQPHGFVRWQTIQLLLDPDEHATYLQNAVARWNIYSPDGTLFPKMIPREAFPAEPDPEMVQWHETVSHQFEFDYWKKNLLRSSPPSFGAYHNQFGQKDPLTPTREDHQARAGSYRSSVPSDQATSRRHQRRQSAEFPQNSSRKSQPTAPRRSAEFAAEYVSPRAPSPPNWQKHVLAQPQPQPQSRGRERRTYSRPVSPVQIPEHSSSDASSEDSSQASPPQRYGHYRHLSPPHVPNARRHSHEAYSRRPHRELSPDSQRRHAYRDAQNASSSRPYDSDSGRRVRQPRVYTDEVRQSRTPGSGYREPTFGESVTVPTSPVYPHVQPRFVNVNNTTYMVHPHAEIDATVMEDPRRGTSYRSGSVTPNPGGSHTYGRPRFSSMGSIHHHQPQPQRWTNVHGSASRAVPPGMLDAEYGRRPSIIWSQDPVY